MRVAGCFASLIVLILICFTIEVSAQTDNRLWSSIRFRKQLSENTRVDIRPIMRHDHNLTRYRNTSIDLALHRKLDNGWFIQFLSRTFFVPEAVDVQFLWVDVGHVFKNSNITFTNRARMHYALDLGGVAQRDFIRYHSSLTPTVSWKVKPIFGIEPWFQMNGINKVTRIRYEVGLLFPKLKRYSFAVLFMKQDSANVEIPTHENLWVATLTYMM